MSSQQLPSQPPPSQPRRQPSASLAHPAAIDTTAPEYEYGDEGCGYMDAFRAANARSPTNSEAELMVQVQEQLKEQRGGLSPTGSAVLREAEIWQAEEAVGGMEERLLEEAEAAAEEAEEEAAAEEAEALGERTEEAAAAIAAAGELAVEGVRVTIDGRFGAVVAVSPTHTTVA